MNREDVINWAREAGFTVAQHAPIVAADTNNWIERMENFAALVAAAEREACAQAIEPINPDPSDWTEFAHDRHEAAMIIRARSKP